jgi:hypothetical protein
LSTTTLWRPVGAYELRLIGASGFRAFPPRLPEQPVFYPVCNEEYAAEIATKWNLDDPNSGYAGFVTRFVVPSGVADRYPRRVVGARRHEELWVPAEELAAFCASFVGPIEVVRGWLGSRFPEVAEWSGALGELDRDALAHATDQIVAGTLRGGPLTASVAPLTLPD